MFELIPLEENENFKCFLLNSFTRVLFDFVFLEISKKAPHSGRSNHKYFKNIIDVYGGSI